LSAGLLCRPIQESENFAEAGSARMQRLAISASPSQGVFELLADVLIRKVIDEVFTVCVQVE
jgi:hypothetical protein